MSDNVLAGWSVLTEWPRLRLGHSVRTDRQLVHYPIRGAKNIRKRGLKYTKKRATGNRLVYRDDAEGDWASRCRHRKNTSRRQAKKLQPLRKPHSANRPASGKISRRCDTSPTVDCCSFSLCLMQSIEEEEWTWKSWRTFEWMNWLSCGDPDTAILYWTYPDELRMILVFFLTKSEWQWSRMLQCGTEYHCSVCDLVRLVVRLVISDFDIFIRILPYG